MKIIEKIDKTYFRACDFESKLYLKECYGEGFLQKIISKESLEVVFFDLKFRRQLHIEVENNNIGHELVFCFSDKIEWEKKNCKKDYSLKKDEACLCKNLKDTSIFKFYKNQRFAGLTIKFPFEYSMSVDKDLNNYLEKSNFKKTIISPFMKCALHYVHNCKYCGSVKKIYIESKVMELIALYIHDLGDHDENIPNITPSEKENLYKAKNILDNSMVNTPTITELSKMIFLNEHKLKKGFKELFGFPVITYVRNKKMEYARELLKGDIHVSQVANMVGYTNVSHFSNTFKKKFGITPGKLLKGPI